MKSEPFVIERTFNAPVERVWKAITDKNEMKQWYFDIASFRAEPGFEFEFKGGNEERTYLHKCKITEVIPNKKLAYSWQYEGFDGYSEVSFELFPEGRRTRLRLTHSGIDSFPADNPDFAKKNFVEGWTQLIDQILKDYLEKPVVKKPLQ